MTNQAALDAAVEAFRKAATPSEPMARIQHVWAVQAAVAAWLEELGFRDLVSIARRMLDRDYPADVFTGDSGDAGAAFVYHLRAALDVLEPEL